MKEKIYNFSLLTMISLAMLSMSISSCSDLSDSVIGKKESDALNDIRPLRLNSLSSGTTSGLTRGTVTELDHATQIGFYVKAPNFTEDGSDTYTEYGNVSGLYNPDTSQWQPVSDIFLSNRNAKMTVYAPYDSRQPGDSLLLTAALAQADGRNDIIARTMEVNNLSVSTGLNVTLSHVYTCLQFNFIKHEDFASSDFVIERLELTGGDIYAEGYYDPYTGNYAPSIKGKADVSLKISDVSIPLASEVAAGDPAAIIRTLLIPIRQTFQEDAHLWITLKQTLSTSSKRIGVKIPKETFTTAQPFAPNKQYNFTVKVSSYESIQIMKVEIEAWGNPTYVGDFTPSFD